MARASYWVLFIWMVISFVALIKYTFRFGYPSFLKEFFVILVLIILAIIALSMVGFRKNGGWVVTAIFFAIILVNMAYLMFKSTSGWIFLNAFIAAIGFVFSTAMIGRSRESFSDYPEAEDRAAEWEKEAGALEEAEKKIKK